MKRSKYCDAQIAFVLKQAEEGTTIDEVAVIRYPQRNGTRRPWLVQLLARQPTKVTAVALAKKNARMAWPLMTSGERYREPMLVAA